MNHIKEILKNAIHKNATNADNITSVMAKNAIKKGVGASIARPPLKARPHTKTILITLPILILLIVALIAIGITNAAGNTAEPATSQTFTEEGDGYYIWVRAVDHAGNKGPWSEAQRIWIDTKPPIVTATSGTAVIEEGESHTMPEYFSYEANGSATVTVNYTVNGTTISNTSSLAVGKHTIICTVTKANGITVTAEKSIVVENYWDGEVNTPVTVSGMIPVYYDSGVWKKADTTNQNSTTKWYDYAEKRWANVATVSSSNLSKYSNAAVGTTITQSEITAMFVWIPRYSYTINGEKNISINFLKNRTNKEASGSITTAIVHPAFTDGSLNDYAEGGWSEPLNGFWIAKFEASGVENGVAVGNANSSSSAQVQAPTANTYVRILPNVISWRHITIGEAQYRSMQMATNTSAYGWTSGSVDSHLLKNDEWGAVAYLCYSKYGTVPKTNGAASYNSTSQYYYDAYTGAGPASTTSEGRYAYTSDHAYSTSNGVLSSTTGNVYGVYDMAGGAWERVGGYLNNGNSYLGTYGKSSSNSSVVYFAKNTAGNYELKKEFQKYWCKYEVGEEERNNAIVINSSTTLTQSQLWSTSLNTTEHNAARLRITTATYNNLANYRGIGVNEVSSSFSYYGVNSSKAWNWFTNTTQPTTDSTTYGRSWDNDLCLIGHACLPFVVRGGYYHHGTGAGVLYTNATGGYSYYYARFPPGGGCA